MSSETRSPKRSKRGHRKVTVITTRVTRATTGDTEASPDVEHAPPRSVARTSTPPPGPGRAWPSSSPHGPPRGPAAGRPNAPPTLPPAVPALPPPPRARSRTRRPLWPSSCHSASARHGTQMTPPQEQRLHPRQAPSYSRQTPPRPCRAPTSASSPAPRAQLALSVPAGLLSVPVYKAVKRLPSEGALHLLSVARPSVWRDSEDPTVLSSQTPELRDLAEGASRPPHSGGSTIAHVLSSDAGFVVTGFPPAPRHGYPRWGDRVNAQVALTPELSGGASGCQLRTRGRGHRGNGLPSHGRHSAPPPGLGCASRGMEESGRLLCLPRAPTKN